MDQGLVFASQLRIGQQLIQENEQSNDSIQSVRVHHEPLSVFNVLTEWPNTFFAEGALVHNKGCFLPDTEIDLADGTKKPISEIREGDAIVSFFSNGEKTSSHVQNILTAQAPGYYELETLNGTQVRATAEHPFFIGDGKYELVENLKVGQRIKTFRGQMKSEVLTSIPAAET
mgnify:CR=1 FL=1